MRFLAFLLLLTSPAMADTVVAARLIRPQAMIQPEDLALKRGDVAGAFTGIEGLIGQEARVLIYPGRAIRPGDVGPPAVVERNQIVMLIYDSGSLSIMTEGRSLGRAGAGDLLRVMNLNSRATVTGRVSADGTVHVSH